MKKRGKVRHEKGSHFDLRLGEINQIAKGDKKNKHTCDKMPGISVRRLRSSHTSFTKTSIAHLRQINIATLLAI
jgi:hypothetical protein